ncbi:helicase-exonuclease AddAB subunit AddA [Acutalibacter sp. 1XD8-36]|uniref:helicase-exonuclease AddAB subunit AddA n=1 Tax=Acutalibacter sp. 1XD8-36 TaxID=2320852 RepID=UPI0014129F30|nr:helicase-exonuclease AddAB subunit AddA [Acutalibacter sp. 1XD8-36]
MKWTDSQWDAIEARKGTVLVAAAAGSGKTAVLVQRAIERLIDEHDPTPANRLLIVTFTKAAAAEMRARLEGRLYELLREDPGNRLLRRQSILLHQAHIGTVDSFCAEMVREFFHLLEISPNFKILSDKREQELMNESLEEALSAAYDNGSVQGLSDAFAAERDDRRITGMVLTLYRFMQSHPFPEKWLNEKIDMYFAGDSSPWERVILEYAAGAAEHAAALLERALFLCQSSGAVEESFAPVLSADREACLALCGAAREGSWDLASQLQSCWAPARRKRLPKGAGDDPLVPRLEAVRGEVKKILSGLSRCLSAPSSSCREELIKAGPLLKSLGELTLAFTGRYSEKKRQKGFLDYSDLEHCAIRLFVREDGSPTPAALEVGGRFDEIMIDEYQDINEVQDSIFRSVSREGKNLFMVGDVKQSIYGFRRAMPEIFLRCRRAFAKYSRTGPSYPAYIVLDRNFRSRQEVTDAVNFVFSQLMSRDAGDIDYTGEERLVYGADFGPKPGCETEACFISRGNASAETAEASYIAKRIRELIDGGFTVSEGDTERPAAFGDFCILLRSANKYAHVYASELKRLGIPARATVSGGFFAAAEIQTMLSLLRVIDNPNQDIPLLALLMSPLYGFSADDAARLRAGNKDASVYVSLIGAAESDPRCRKAIEELAALRSLAATMPADGFLTMLYTRTGYTDMVLAMDEGSGRLANLHLLQRYAQEYEGSGYHGLSGFVRFLDRLRDSGTDLQAAELQPSGGDAVNIMSIHKSKGLQFPVCIVAGCGRQFAGDQAEEVLLHPELGLGVKLRDRRGVAKFTTTAREAIALETARSNAAEELRVLYVAMTRAQEKLIMVSSAPDMAQSLQKAAMEAGGPRVSPFTVRRSKSAAQWLMLCALRHPDGGELRELAGMEEGVLCSGGGAPWKISLTEYEPAEAAEAPIEEQAAAPDPRLYAALKAQAAFLYPYTDVLDVPAKVSASKLAAQQGGSRELNLSRPAWTGQQGMTPAQRGIALHEFMQFADFPAAARDPKAEIQRLSDQLYLTPEQAGAVEVKRVRAFFSSPLGQRVLASPQVEKERRFTAVIPAGMAQPGTPAGDEPVVLQGSVDCTFIENGRLNIIDFKTDRVEDMEELWRRYILQLKLYAYAMREVTGLAIGEMFLYSTWLSEGSGKLYDETETV